MSAVLVRVLVGIVMLYGALLRFDAITLTHGPVQTPAWIGAIQQTRSAQSGWRPAAMTWSRWEGRYISDPYTYLQYAREPRGFYDAHRREPGFVFATKLSLWIFGNQDAAVSWASMMFSLLAVAGTFLLGRRAYSPAVGLIAAGALAIEMTVITWAVGGWRDEAFTCAVLFTCHGLLKYRSQPTARNAVVLGIIMAAACLIRITALSFVVPAIALMWGADVLSPRRQLKGMALAAATAAVLVAPYLINCWRVFGDPLYAINVHADIYRAAEGERVEVSQTASQYLISGLRTRPFRTIDTTVQGLTSYPFMNKWDGFAVWHPWLGSVLASASLIGIVMWLASAPGRILLGVLLTSLVPYAITWRLIGDWRFTSHAYPFLLMAAACVFVSTATACRPAWWRTVWPRIMPTRGSLVAGAACALALIAGLWIVLVPLPSSVASETLRLDGVVTVLAGGRDWAVFDRGWMSPITQGNVTARLSVDSAPSISIPTVAGRPYELTMRLDPFPAPASTAALPVIRVFADGQAVGRLQLTWTPDRVGAYVVPMPPAAASVTQVQLLVDQRAEGSSRIRFWWSKIRLL